tara:strand:+ start:252 stop:509 length:258 start_codon:yes stop_codon:yes gene_type:complete
MKTELSKISQELEQGTINNKEARILLLCLLGVSESKLPTLNDVHKYYYQKQHFDDKGNLKIEYISDRDQIINELILGFSIEFYSR